MTHNAPVIRRFVLLMPLLLWHAAPVGAHAVGVSRGEYRAENQQVRADLVFARPELLTALPALDQDRDGTLSSTELDRAHSQLAGWIERGIVVRIAAGGCPGTLTNAVLTEQDGVQLVAIFRCPANPTAFSLRLDLLGQLSLGHRHVVTTIAGAQTEHAVLYESQPELALAPPAAGDEPAFFRLGVMHILTGYDHLLFLLALVLVGGSLRSIAVVVTIFTLAHSVTLAVAALGWWAPRPALIGPAIALSIAYLGIENCFAPNLRQRWRLTFLFGLIHGFGFAGALQTTTLSAQQLPIALASFNLGVEAGQFAVLALMRPVVSWLGEREWFARGGLQATSLAISAMGMWWFIARVTGG